VESHLRTYSILRKNVETLCGPPSASGGALRLIKDDALRFLRGEPPGEPFDIIFADPPYGIEARGGAWVLDALAAASQNGFLKPETVFVMEQSVRDPVHPAPGWREPDARTYGETALVFYGREGQP
jgi:16S rRNA (guanine966-N2)-methyltransferase